MKKCILLLCAVFVATALITVITYRWHSDPTHLPALDELTSADHPSETSESNPYIHNRYRVGFSYMGFSEFLEHEFVMRHVRILYPEVKGTRHDEKINAILSARPSELIAEVLSEYDSLVADYVVALHDNILLAGFSYTWEVLFDRILVVTCRHTGGIYGMIDDYYYLHIDLKSGELLKLTDFMAVGDRLLQYRATNYEPPNPNSAAVYPVLSFEDAFPECSIETFLKEMESGYFSWFLTKEHLCLANAESTDLFIYIPYADLEESVDARYRSNP